MCQKRVPRRCSSINYSSFDHTSDNLHRPNVFIFAIILFSLDTERPRCRPFYFWFYFQKFPFYYVITLSFLSIHFVFVYNNYFYCCCHCCRNNGRQVVIFQRRCTRAGYKIIVWIILYTCTVVVGTHSVTFFICWVLQGSGVVGLFRWKSSTRTLDTTITYNL